MNGARIKIAATAAGLTFLSSATLADDHFEGGTVRGLEQLAASDRRPTGRELAPHGYAATGSAERTVVIEPGTRWINVTQLETVELRMNGKSVAWTFDTFGTRPFPLSAIVPGARDVTVYAEESPLYRDD
jgi:hypothetical protein